MHLREDIRPAAELQARASELLHDVGASRRPMVLVEGDVPKGVLLDVGTYQQLRDGLLLLKLVAQGEADLSAGRVIPQEQVSSIAIASCSLALTD